MFVVYICDKELEYTCYNLEIVAPNNILGKKQKMNIMEGIHSRSYSFINTPLLTMAEIYVRVENRPAIHYTNIGCMLLNTEKRTLS